MLFRSRGADVEVREAHAFVVEAIHVRRLEQRVPVRGDVAVALVVGEDEQDVGSLAGEGGGSLADRDGKERPEQEAEQRGFHAGTIHA